MTRRRCGDGKERTNMIGEMDGALHEVRAGRVSFDAFVRSTIDRWRRIAAKLLREWRDTPGWLPHEDVVQDLLLAAWRCIPKWDESKGRTLEDYVIWNAKDKARKNIHRARFGKRRHRGEEHTRATCDRPASSFVRQGEDGDESTVPEVTVQPDQHDVMEVRRAFREAREHAASVPELLAVQAIEVTGGDLESAAAMLYDDKDARLICGIVGEDDEVDGRRKAYGVAARAAMRVVGRIAIQDAAAA